MKTEIISVLSLVVAIFAVFVGPLISLKISKKQIESAQKTAKLQTLGPMRQVWINSLRDMIADITSRCLHYWQTGTYQDLENVEYGEINHIRHKLELMLNPKEEKHRNLITAIKLMTETAGAESAKEDEPFFESYNAVMKLSKEVLKEEWNVIKET